MSASISSFAVNYFISQWDLKGILILPGCCLSAPQKSKESHAIPRAMLRKGDGCPKPLFYPVSHLWCSVPLCSEHVLCLPSTTPTHIELPYVSLERYSHLGVCKSSWKSNHPPFHFWGVSRNGIQRMSLYLC